MGSKKVDNILTVRGLFKQYQKRSAIVKAVDNVDFEINKGEIVGLIGESGSGKTTLSRLVTRLEEPTFGEIIFNNNLISKPRLKKSEKHDLYSKMQMIFQNPYSSLNDRFNLINIISEPIRVTKKIDEEVEFLSSNEKELEKTYAKTLSIFYHTNYELTRETINKMELEAMQDTINRVDEINKNFLDIDINETLTAFFEIFEKKFDYNSKIIDNLSDLLNTLDNNFRLALKNLKNNVITKDEQELFEARKSLETFKKYNAELPFVYHELGVLRDDLTQLVKDQKAELENRVHEQKRLLSGIMDQIKRLIAKQTHAISLSKTLLENVAATLKRDMLRTYLKFIEIRYKSFNSFDLTTIENIDIEILKVIDDISAKLVMSFDKTMYDSKKHRVLIIDKANRNFYKVAKEKIDSALKTYSDPKIEEYKKNVSRLKQNIEYLAKVSHTPDTIEENRKILVKLQENYEKAKQDYNYEAKRFDELIFLPAVAQNNKVKRKNDIAHQKLDGVAKTASRRIYTLNKRLERAVFDFYRSSLNRGKEIDYTAKTFKSTFKEKNTQDNALKYEVKALVELLTNSVQQSYLIKKRGPNYKSNLKKVLIRSKVFDILKQVGLKSSHAYRYPHEFSGGQRQRIAIARALISEPELLIADEPIAALDVSIQAQIVNLLVDLAKKRNFSMLFIAHDLAMVNHIADRIYIMHKGIIVEKGNTKLIFEKPAHPYTKRLMESMPSIDNVNQEFEEIPDLDDYRSGYLKNPPRFYQINNESKNHFVFGNNEQFDE